MKNTYAVSLINHSGCVFDSRDDFTSIKKALNGPPGAEKLVISENGINIAS